MTVVAAVGAAWIVRRGADRFTEPQARILSARRHTWWSVAVAMISMAFVLVLYTWVTLKWEAFADYDDSYFTLWTLKGRNLALLIWSNGRFFPLSDQEFNLVRHVSGSVAGYHALPLVELLVFSFLLVILDDELSVASRMTLAIFVLLVPGIVISYTGFVFPERNIAFWLVLLVFSVRQFDRTRATPWAAAAMVCAQFMLYYKETAFLLLWGFGAGRLLLRCKRPDRSGWEFERLRDKESLLDICLISLGVLFLLYYTAAMVPHLNTQYAEQQRFPVAQILLYYAKTDLLAWILVAVVFGRAYLFARHRLLPSPLWDGLAVGGVGYFAAYLYLRLSTPYYLAPVDVIAILFVGRLAIASWPTMKPKVKAVALVLAFAALVQGILLSAFREFERKNTIHAKVEIADLIVARYRSAPGSVPRLFFPFADVYPITEFASYLTFRGVPVEEATETGSTNKGVILVTPNVAKDGPCVSYRPFICLAADRPHPSDLVIELPDDGDSSGQMTEYDNGGETLLSYEPSPRLPRWVHPLVSKLRVASVRFEYKELPDRWLHASLIEWK